MLHVAIVDCSEDKKLKVHMENKIQASQERTEQERAEAAKAVEETEKNVKTAETAVKEMKAKAQKLEYERIGLRASFSKVNISTAVKLPLTRAVIVFVVGTVCLCVITTGHRNDAESLKAAHFKASYFEGWSEGEKDMYAKQRKEAQQAQLWNFGTTVLEIVGNGVFGVDLGAV